ncbi:nitric oxide dioxygenase, partial [Bacillus thuringiensis]|nr:nitric oxide dioxygenase [Bacillus thuringiensis]
EQDSKRNVYFIHAAINSNTHAMKEHVKAVENEYEQVKAYTCYSAPTEKDLEMKNFDKEGFVESEWLKTIIQTTEAEFYFCGPVAFMKHINAALTDLGVKQEHIHYEFFGPATSLQ